MNRDFARRVYGAVFGALLVAAAPASASGQAASCEDVVDRDVIPLERAQPGYPMEAAMFCVEGYARYQFTIGADGRVTDAKVVESVPEGVFDNTEEVFDFWRFAPRCIDGEAVSRTATQQIDFNLQGGGPSPCSEGLPASAEGLQIELVALMQQVHHAFSRGRGIRIDPQPVLDAPYAEIEGAYRRFFRDQVDFMGRQFHAWQRDFGDQLGHRDETPGLDLERHLERLERSRVLFDELALEWADLTDRFSTELAAAAEASALDPRVRRVFVDPMLDSYAMGRELRHVRAPVVALMESECALVQWMLDHQHEWEFADDGFRFASDRLEQEYRALAAAREDATTAVRLQQARQSMMWSPAGG